MNVAKVISILLLCVLGFSILSPSLSFWAHEETHLSDCLEFAHIHTDEEEDCHGGMIAGTLFFPQAKFNPSEFLRSQTTVYPIFIQKMYQNPLLYPHRKPPRTS
ncbi:MAG: hypothetical protein JNM24_10515 [Bdellovibrionaceae bacterium]|nr:hypothetical protein [Pseudobdellovibrionaceae bacterium]